MGEEFLAKRKIVYFASLRFLRTGFQLLFGNAADRRRVRQECARMAASLFGDFPISEDHKLWREDNAFLSDYRRLSPENPYSEDRKYVLRELVRFTRNVPGVMAECGSFRGASAYFLAKEAPDIPLHLFDSFQGLSEPGDKDFPPKKDRHTWKQGAFFVTEEEVRRNLSEFSRIILHKGWIPDRFPDVTEERFRLVHIDVDLYKPTLESIKFFYPRMNPGGVIVIDDYGFTTCPGAHQAVKEYMEDKPEYVLHLPTGQGIIIKQ